MTTSSELRHAGIGWPNGAVDNAAVFALPSPNLLMLATEGRYHHDKAVGAGKRCLWRAVPRIGRRPAELKWSPARFLEEALNLVNEPRTLGKPNEPIRDFVFANELDLNSERGDGEDDWSNLNTRYALIGGWAYSLVPMLRQALPGTRLHWPAWTPDHSALDYGYLWQEAAGHCDVIDIHAYDSLANIQRQYSDYRQVFPSMPLALTEWHCKGDLSEEQRVLHWLALMMAEDPLFEAAYFFIWRWWGHPGWWDDSWDIEHDPDRLALFSDPPLAAIAEPAPPPPEPEPPIMPEPEPAPSPALNPWEHWTAEQIAGATGCQIEAVRDHWPRLVGQLDLCGINDRMVQAAMIGTVAIETASTFAPVREAFWLSEEWRKANLRYYPFYGRGFIQLTWEANYRAYGDAVNELWHAGGAIDLVARPDDALDPDVSAACAALYFRDHGDGGIPVAARAGDWREVRRLVQGADAGLDRLTEIVAALGVTAPVEPSERAYGPDVPDGVIFQQNSWTCAVRSTYAALWAMAAQGQAPAVTYGDNGPRDVYDWLVPQWDGPDIGLLDHTGAGLAEALRQHGYTASSAYPVTLDQVRERAGTQPILLGGDTWNHWVYVRGRTNDSGLILENPSPGHAGISDYLRDSFGRLGPMAMVWIDGFIDVAQPSEPQPEPAPSPYAVGPGVLALMAEHGDEPASDEVYPNPFWSETMATSGAYYRWLKATGHTFRYDPAA